MIQDNNGWFIFQIYRGKSSEQEWWLRRMRSSGTQALLSCALLTPGCSLQPHSPRWWHLMLQAACWREGQTVGRTCFCCFSRIPKSFCVTFPILYYWSKLSHMVTCICREAGKHLYSWQFFTQLKILWPWIKARIDMGEGLSAPVRDFMTPTMVDMWAGSHSIPVCFHLVYTL